MAVISSTKDFWMHSNGLTFAINYFGNPQLIQTSLLAGAVILAYRKDVIGYNAAHNFREWKLQAFPTQLSDTCTYYVHVELSRTGNTAMVIYSPVIRDMQGRTLLSGNRESGTYDDNVSADSWFIYIGTLSASVDSDGNTVERAWTDGVYTGTLATDQYRMEEASGDWVNMFSLNSVTGLIDVLKTISKATINALTVAKEFVFGGKTFTDVAGIDDAGDDSKVNDSTLPTTGYVAREIEALDEHFLIKDNADAKQSVAGPVTFEQDVTVQGDHAVEGVQTIGKGEPGNINVEKVVQEVKGKQILHGGFQTPNFNNAAGQITGAHLTPDGKLFVSGLKANNFEIDQLIFNVVKAQGGEYVYSTSTIIESCTYVMTDGTQYTPDEFYALDTHDWQQIDHILITLKEDEFTGYGNPFDEGDIIYGKVNQVMESGKHAVGGECIMYVTAVEDNTLNITAKLYQVGEEGVVGNIPPIEDMVIAQRGNKNGTAGRTTSFYLSTITGNLVMLYNVTTPTLSAANYGASFGKLPYDLYLEVHKVYAGITEHDPVTYSKYIVTENWIQFDHLGQPIKFEVYRGDWRLDVAQSDKPYVETASTYDTVTHNGAKWRIRTSKTTTEPSDAYGDWERITDANITLYALSPSSNIVYLRDGGVVSPSELDITVTETTSLGTETISDQATLVGKNLTVWYTIDGDDTRHMLVLGGAAVFETEDGTSVFATEADSESESVPLYLEGESIDLSQVADNITLYLVEGYPDNPVDRATYVIPVVRDGAAPLGLELTPSALSVPVDAETQATAGVRSLTAIVRLKQGIAYVTDLTDYSLSLTFEKTDGTTSENPPLAYYEYIDYEYAYDTDGNRIGWKVMVITKDSMSKANLLERISVIVKHNDSVVATDSISFVYLERGITGPAGQEGPMLFPCGTWDINADYSMVYELDSDGNPVVDDDGNKIIVAKPFVYNEADGKYYVLAADVKGTDQIPIGNTDFWRPFTAIKYLFTEIFMANWAKLASAIFNGDYMFSMKGIDYLGNYGDYSAHQEGDYPMFTNVGEGDNIHKRLNGNFIPNLFLDFKSGEAKVGKLSETYTRVTAKEYAGGKICIPPLHVVNLDNCHNVSCQAVMNDVDGTCAVVLPKASNGVIVDGTHSIIVHEYSTQYSDMPTDENYSSSVIAVCADEAMLNTDADFSSLFTWTVGEESASTTSDGWFIWRGYRTKLILLTPGSMLQLRSCVLEDGGMVWFIENSSDFEILKATFEFYQDYDNDDSPSYSFTSNDTTAIEAIYRSPIVLGSPTINHIAGASNAGYDEGINTSWVWNATGNLAEDTVNTGDDGYRGCYIMEHRDIL